MDITQKLEKLAELRDRKIITEEEFLQQKAKLLGSNMQKNNPPPLSVIEELADIEYRNPQQKKTMSLLGKFNRIVGLSIAILLLWLVFSGQEEKPADKQAITESSIETDADLIQTKKNESPIANVDIADIISEYSENEIRAGDKYNGKFVIVRAQFAGVQKYGDEYFVTIKNKEASDAANIMIGSFVFMPAKYKDYLSSLNLYQSIEWKCKVTDGATMSVNLTNCTPIK